MSGLKFESIKWDSVLRTEAPVHVQIYCILNICHRTQHGTFHCTCKQIHYDSNIFIWLIPVVCPKGGKLRGLQHSCCSLESGWGTHALPPGLAVLLSPSTFQLLRGSASRTPSAPGSIAWPLSETRMMVSAVSRNAMATLLVVSWSWRIDSVRPSNDRST